MTRYLSHIIKFKCTSRPSPDLNYVYGTVGTGDVHSFRAPGITAEYMCFLWFVTVSVGILLVLPHPNYFHAKSYRLVLLRCLLLKQERQNRRTNGSSNSGEIGFNFRTNASFKSQIGLEQLSGGVSVLCGLAAPIANVLSKLP